MNVPSGMPGDELTGSPELFATNLLIVRAIEHEMRAVIIRKTNNEVLVQNVHDEREYEEETLTEQLDKWQRIKDRFQSMTSHHENDPQSGELKPKTPATSRVESIKIEYPDDSTIELTFNYPD